MFCFFGGVEEEVLFYSYLCCLCPTVSFVQEDSGIVRGNFQQINLALFSQHMNNIFIFDPVLVFDFHHEMTGRRLFWNSFVFVFLYERICGSTQGTGRAVCVGGGRGGKKEERVSGQWWWVGSLLYDFTDKNST